MPPKIVSPPKAVATAQGGGTGNIASGNYYILTMWVAPGVTPDNHFSAGAVVPVPCTDNDSILVQPPVGNPPLGATTYAVYMADSLSGIFKLAGTANAGSTLTITNVGNGAVLVAFGYGWQKEGTGRTVVDPMGTFTDDLSLSGTAWNNPAYEVTLSPWVSTDGSVIVRLRPGFNRGGQIGQEYLFYGGVSTTVQWMTDIICSGGFPQKVVVTANIINGMVKAAF